jgi:quercetin dioxygenase-like cupin family protein
MVAMAETASFLIREQDGDLVELTAGGVGIHFKIEGDRTQGAVALVEHPVAPGGFALPHTHSREDEISYVLAGRIAAEIDGREFTVEAGEYLFKPRGLKHAFWNPTDQPARLIEIIAPAGLERFFRMVSTLRLVPGTADEAHALEITRGFGVELDVKDREAFLARHGLKIAMPPER